MEAYCMKCRMKREINDPVAAFNTAGAPITKGTCGICGTKLFRIGKTDAHEGMVKPERSSNRSGKLVIVESCQRKKKAASRQPIHSSGEITRQVFLRSRLHLRRARS